MRFILLLLITLTLSNAQNREALLIGNSNYKHISNLDDPSYNLNRLKKTLKVLNFKVKIRTNLNSENLESAIDNFASRLSRSSDTIGLLYYTGHGCQVDYQGYLVPTNVDTQKKLKIKYNALNINKMLETLKEAGNRVNMVFLDACRDVPTGAKGGTKGLGQPVARPKGSLIVYATESGKVANDNSKFINSLIENISKPNQSIRNIGDNISNDVAQKSAYAQIPEVYTKLLPSIVLKRGGYVPPIEPVVPVTPLVITSKWIVSTNSICKANGGKIYKGVCQANWKNAKKICSTSGGRLPTRSELRKVVVDCGGLFTTYGDKDWDSLTDKNIANKSYQSCYKQKGFRDNDWYWTSEEKDSSQAWNVYFDGGGDNWGNKSDTYSALCVQ